MKYPVNEVFQTIQGEGVHTGVPSLFVRLQGCPVGCAWCDTKHTWEVNPEDETDAQAVSSKTLDSACYANLTAEQLLELFKQKCFKAKHIVITGGEPCLYDLTALCNVMEQAGYTMQIETSGTSEVLVSPKTWVTVSPKIGMKGGLPVLSSAMQRANEIKHPVAREADIEELDALLKQSELEQEKVAICLQPISQKARATRLCMDTCIERNWRLSVQTHKYIGIA